MNFRKNIILNTNFSFKDLSSAFLNQNRVRFLAFQKGVME